MKKKQNLVLLTAILALPLYAQNRLCYTYDATGNRIYRLATTLRSNEMTRSVNDSISLLSETRSDIQLSQTISKLKVEIMNWDKGTQANITVYDMSGREMFSEFVISGVTFIDISRLSRGTYILSLCLNGETTSRKFNK